MQLRDLTYSRSVAAVPFAGRYRCIDFMISNLVNTGISNVALLKGCDIDKPRNLAKSVTVE